MPELLLLARPKHQQASRGQDRSAPPPSRASTGKVGASCRPGRGTPPATRVAGFQDVAGSDEHQTERGERRARGGLASRSARDQLTPATPGGSLRNREAPRHRLTDNVGYMFLLLLFVTLRGRDTSMKKPMLFVSHKAGAYPSDLPGLIKGRSFISPPQGPRRYIAGTKGGHVTRCQPTAAPAAGYVRREASCLTNRVKEEGKTRRQKVCPFLLPDRATIPSTTAERCRQLWAGEAARLVIGGAVWLAAGREAIGHCHWLRISWAGREAGEAREAGVLPFQSRCGEAKRKAARRGGEPCRRMT